jgi:hypothetical protein
MAETQTLKKLKRTHWRSIEGLLKSAYREGLDAGIARARGQSRRGRTIREDATVGGLVRRIESHFGLDRYGFEVRIVHKRSRRAVTASDQIVKYRIAG